MLLDEKLTPKVSTSKSNTPKPTEENSVEKATAPTVQNDISTDAKTIVFAVGGFFVFIFVLDKLEKVLKGSVT
jgi:hypothetical protein